MARDNWTTSRNYMRPSRTRPLCSARVTLTGELVVHEADGAQVLLGAGRTIFASDFTVEFQAGPSGFLDLLGGDPSAIGSLCAALVAT